MKKKPVKIWAEDLNIDIFPKKDTLMPDRYMRRCSTWLITREKQIKTTSATSHWSEWPSLRSLHTTNAGEGVEKRESLLTAGGNGNWCHHYGKQYRGSSKS